MNNKLLQLGANFTIENLVNRVNEVIGNKFDVLEKNDDILKWNSIPKLYLLDDNIQHKVLEFVEYMDTLLIPIEKKAMYVISLSGIIEFTNIIITNYDNGDLFLLALYYEDKSIEEMKNTFFTISNKNLLSTIRNKTLDLDIRKKILLNFVNSISSSKIDITNNQQVLLFTQEYIKKLEAIDSKELV